MRYINFDFLSQNQHGSAFRQYLRIRKGFFVDELDWDIPHNKEVEMDQYDNPCAHYTLVLQDSTVVGGVRIMPTTSEWGHHSYMLRDALLGRIGIPAAAISEEIVTEGVWECTRLVVSDTLESYAERTNCLSLILDGIMQTVQEQGGQELISLSPVTLRRTLRQLGYAARRVGDPYLESDGRRYAMLRMPAYAAAQSIAAE